MESLRLFGYSDETQLGGRGGAGASDRLRLSARCWCGQTARLCTVSVLVSRVKAAEPDTPGFLSFTVCTVPRLQTEGARMGRLHTSLHGARAAAG